MKQTRPTQATILRKTDAHAAASGRRRIAEGPMLNLIWPSVRRRDVGTAGAFGRVIHWLGVIVAVLCALLAMEFTVEGWARHLSRDLLATALILTFGTRAVRYMLARE